MCAEKDGLHWAEDHILVEVLDPATLVPVAEGERGELVLTTLRKAARPMIRFRTGNIVSFTSEPCRCGRTSIRMRGVHGRLDDMLIIKGSTSSRATSKRWCAAMTATQESIAWW